VKAYAPVHDRAHKVRQLTPLRSATRSTPNPSGGGSQRGSEIHPLTQQLVDSVVGTANK
jgi:hypothetical protein